MPLLGSGLSAVKYLKAVARAAVGPSGLGKGRSCTHCEASCGSRYAGLRRGMGGL